MIIGSRLCTLNFLFQAPDGTRYTGAAGHCMAWEIGPMAVGGDGKRFGEFASAVFERDDDYGLVKDFAVIRLDPGVDASPDMCHFGAPRDLFTTDTADPVVLNYYGNGTASGAVAGDAPPARSAVAFGTPNPDRIWAEGVVVQGDGGAGVMTADGLAIGVIATSGPARPGSEPPLPSEKGGDVGTIGITRLAGTRSPDEFPGRRTSPPSKSRERMIG